MLETVHLHYVEYRYNQIIKATNDGKDYYIIGEMQNVPNTLLVTLVDGNGGGRYLCRDHHFVYPVNGKCVDCQNATLDSADDAMPQVVAVPNFDEKEKDGSYVTQS